MKPYSFRNKIIIEFSGHEEASENLRTRIKHWVDQHHRVVAADFYGKLRLYKTHDDYTRMITAEEYSSVFDVVEILLEVYRVKYGRTTQYFGILADAKAALDLSGSVYQLDHEEVCLRISENEAKIIEEAQKSLENTTSASGKYTDTVGKMMSRKISSEDAVKNIFIALEDYLKERTSENDFSKAVNKIDFLHPMQKVVLQKLKGYRDDAYGVAHAGNNNSPTEVDALWYLNTVNAQLLLLDNKFTKEIK